MDSTVGQLARARVYVDGQLFELLFAFVLDPQSQSAVDRLSLMRLLPCKCMADFLQSDQWAVGGWTSEGDDDNTHRK